MRKVKNRLISILTASAIVATSIFSISSTAFAAMADGSTDIAYKAASEGIVLLKNDNDVLPISSGKTVSLFGRTQVDTIKGGTGSGNVNVDYTINILDGIRAKNGFSLNGDLAAVYEQWCAENPTGESESGSLGLMGGAASYAEMPLTDAQVQEAANKSDVAVVTIGRISGEGSDRVTEAGDYYLSEGEEAMLEIVSKYFDKIAVVLNIGGVIDMNWVDDYGIDSVLLVWQAGMEGGYAIADTLSGVINPSGKLTDTFAINYSDYPADSIGSFAPDKDSEDGIVSDPVYNEDIYVGYRYFETFGIDVKYEFGYGLSYTTFSQKVTGFSADGNKITVAVEVTNTGNVAGKEVVQIYYSAPQGLLGKPSKELAAYGKTDTLKPGESQTLTISYDATDMSSYDDGGKVAKSAYIMEAGDYVIYSGNSVKNVEIVGTYTLSETIVTEQLTEQLAANTSFNRLTANGTYEAVPQRTVSLEDIVYDIPEEIEYTGDQGYLLIDVYNGTITMDQFIAQLPQETLTQLIYGLGMDLLEWGYEMLPDDCVKGAAGGYGYIYEFGIPAATVADGPAGVRIDKDANGGTTAFPIGTMLACTWNEDLLQEVGDMIGKENAVNGVDGWLAPGMNIHRDPLCGRNFEYYSEDPIVTGVTAAAITRGVQANGVGVTIKHYAVNSQETDRMTSTSYISERAMREIYLKGFEVAVKTSDPWYVMTSYNKINGTYAASSYELNTNILRGEWGFDGTVMTDWLAVKDNGEASMVRAQNDLCMPGGLFQENVLAESIEAGDITVAEIQRSVKNILNSLMQTLAFSNYYNLDGANANYVSPSHWFSVAKSSIYTITATGQTSDDTSTTGTGTSSKVSSPRTDDNTIVLTAVLLILTGSSIVLTKKRKNI